MNRLLAVTCFVLGLAIMVLGGALENTMVAAMGGVTVGLAFCTMAEAWDWFRD